MQRLASLFQLCVLTKDVHGLMNVALLFGPQKAQSYVQGELFSPDTSAHLFQVIVRHLPGCIC